MSYNFEVRLTQMFGLKETVLPPRETKHGVMGCNNQVQVACSEIKECLKDPAFTGSFNSRIKIKLV